jgi:hypothetical protein
MFSRIAVCLLVFTSSVATTPLLSQQSWTPDQEAVIVAIEALSESTALGGGGADAYADQLAGDFSRWTVGQTTLSPRDPWVVGIRDWLESGWRVADRSYEMLQIDVLGDLAFTRRLVEEHYLGPNGERTDSRAAIAEVWTREEGTWLLLRANVHPMS